MKLRYMKYSIVAAAVGLTFTACDDFLDRPAEDSYNTDNFYQNDTQLYQSVNTIYNSPWYDFQRGFFKVGEVMAGNYYWGQSPYLTFTTNSTDQDLVNMSASLWSVNAYCNVAIKNIDEKHGSACTQTAINAAKGEALTWKAMAYFYLVRNFGGVPIVHNNTASIAAGDYNTMYRAKPENVYEYIIKTLEKAIEWLPAKAAEGRIDKYCAEGLLAKVYLTRAGLSGSLNAEDLKKAVSYAKDVKENSGRTLMKNFSDIFRLANNTCSESLIAWRWTAEGTNWTRQNSLQSDLAPGNFSEYGDTWGGWQGPSADLIEAFGDNPLSAARANIDARRKATLMMAGDVYEYFWTDCSSSFIKGGFEILDFNYCKDEARLKARGGRKGEDTFQGPCGAQSVKHLVGDDADHVAGCGQNMARMATSLATHILRLSDVYLVLAEAQALIDGGSTSNSDAIDAFYAVRNRSVSSAIRPSVITWDDVWKERRLELACEGDRWYDFVRLHYYKPQEAITELKSQRRSTYYGLGELYKSYYADGSYNTSVFDNVTSSVAGYDANPVIPNVTDASFILPFPDTDLGLNPHLSEDPVEVDINQYNY